MATFKTTVLKSDGMNATGLPLPSTVVEKPRAGRRPKVTVTLKGYTYRSTVAVYGGECFLPLAAVHREVAGVKAGQSVQVPWRWTARGATWRRGMTWPRH